MLSKESAEAPQLLASCAERLGIGHQACMELAIRVSAQKEKQQ